MKKHKKLYKVVLWGMGGGYDLFLQLHGYEMISVEAITDKKESNLKYIDGIPVVRPEEVKDIKFDYIIVTVLTDELYKNILKKIDKLGISRDIVLPLRIFQIPFFDFNEYIAIKNSNISVLSDYCFAGYLYHRFGMKFMSPTINMYTNNDNYIRFISNLEKYMNTSLIEIDPFIDEELQGTVYPRGRIDDIEWVFNHDDSFDTARERWKKGVNRFNWDNFLVVMTLENDEMAERFNALPLDNKIGFYYKNLDLDSVVYLPEWQLASVRKKYREHFHVYVNDIAAGGLRTINWIERLKHKEVSLRLNYRET